MTEAPRHPQDSEPGSPIPEADIDAQLTSEESATAASLMADSDVSISQAPADLASVIRIQGITKEYPMEAEIVRALRGVDLEIFENEYVAIMGSSGSGKSTLMNILGLLDIPSGGDYWLNGINTSRLSQTRLAAIRSKEIGFVFQTFELLPKQTALRNVELPLMYSGTRGRRRKAEAALARVGLQDRMHHRPSQMSGGQRQRVAIARALVQQPSLLLADEPTGNLDTKTGDEIMELFDVLHHEGQTIVVVTHEPEIADRCHRIIRLSDGQVASDERRATPPPIAETV